MQLSRIIGRILFIGILAGIPLLIIFTKTNSTKPAKAQFEHIVLDDGNLLSLSETLGEKKMTNSNDIETVFDQNNNYILVGKGWHDAVRASERTGTGAQLSIINRETGEQIKVMHSSSATFGALLPDGVVVYTTSEQDLFLSSADGQTQTQLPSKAVMPAVSTDGTKVTYQKLPDTWQMGEYFDQALGIAVLDLETRQETMLSTKPEDFAPIFLPNGEKIIFSSINENGITGLFSMSSDGAERTPLTNADEKTIDSSFVPLPSERPLFSEDGNSMIFESDRSIWSLELADNMQQVEESKRIGYGVNPEWVEPGESISIIAAPDSKENNGLIQLDLEGNLLE